MALSDKARAQRLKADIYIGTLLFQHARQLGVDIQGQRFLDMVTSIRSALKPKQVYGDIHRVDTGQLLSLIDTELFRQPDTAQQLKQRQDADAKAAGETGPDGNKVVPLALRAPAENEDRGRTSERRSYSDLPAGESQIGPGSIKFLNEMRSFAMENGLAWATSAPDLLRLGKPALLEIAKAHIQKQDFAALKKDLGLEAKDVVTVAKFASTFHQDGHKVSQDLVNNVKAVEPDDAAKRHLLGKSAVQLMDIASKNPHDPAVVHKAAQALVDSYKGDKIKQEKVRKLTDSIEQAVQDETATANLTSQKLTEKVTKKENKAQADQAIDDEFALPAATATARDDAQKKNNTASADTRDKPSETAKADAADRKNKESKNTPDAKQTAAVVSNPKSKVPQPTVMG